MNNLRALRKKAGLSIEDLARKVEASISLISKLERGERNVSFRWVNKLATALDCAPSEIVGDNIETLDSVPTVPYWMQFKPHKIDSPEMDRILPVGCQAFIEIDAPVEDSGVYMIKYKDELKIRRVRIKNGPMRFEGDSASGSVDTLFPDGPFSVIGRVRGAILTVD